MNTVFFDLETQNLLGCRWAGRHREVAFVVWGYIFDAQK